MWRLLRRKVRNRQQGAVQNSLYAAGPGDNDLLSAALVSEQLYKFAVTEQSSEVMGKGTLHLQFGLLNLRVFSATSRHPWMKATEQNAGRGNSEKKKDSTKCDALIYVACIDDTIISCKEENEKREHFVSFCERYQCARVILILVPQSLAEKRCISSSETSSSKVLKMYRSAVASLKGSAERRRLYAYVLSSSSPVTKLISFLSGAMENDVCNQAHKEFHQHLDNTSVTFSQSDADDMFLLTSS